MYLLFRKVCSMQLSFFLFTSFIFILRSLNGTFCVKVFGDRELRDFRSLLHTLEPLTPTFPTFPGGDPKRGLGGCPGSLAHQSIAREDSRFLSATGI